MAESFVAIRPGAAFAYVTCATDTSGEAAVIDIASNTVVATVTLGFVPQRVAITPF